MSYEVVYTMSREATPAEWEVATTLLSAWLERSTALSPALFANADIRIGPESLLVDLVGAEDLVVDRNAATTIWSARTASPDAARVLAGVLLTLQFACGGDTFQLSGSKKGEWQRAATLLAPVWGGAYPARTMAPRRFKADTLVYVDHGENARLLREYFRTHLDLDEAALPDRDFRDLLADS